MSQNTDKTGLAATAGGGKAGRLQLVVEARLAWLQVVVEARLAGSKVWKVGRDTYQNVKIAGGGVVL